jgi:DNA-directed RNA polymerase specialized sigma24 family protein
MDPTPLLPRPVATDSDEQALLRRAQAGERRAVNELALGYYEELGDLLAGLARRAGLQAADVKDARQLLFFAVQTAVARFKSGPDGTCRCRFRTFLHRVATGLFRNWLKRRWRGQCREQAVGLAAARAAGPSRAPGSADWLCPPAEWKDEPALAAQRREALAAVPGILAQLGEVERRVGQGMLDGTPRGELARRLALRPYAVGRVWHRVLAVLRTRLKTY